MKEFLKSKKLRITDFRLDVLAILKKHVNAVSAEQIEHALKDFDRITLYRTIKTFKEKGVIHEIIMRDGVKKWALCAEDCMEEDHLHHHEHLHFHCDNCREVYCVDFANFPTLGLNGFSVDRLDIQAFGSCERCV